MRIFTRFLASLALVGWALTSQAALIDLGNGTVRDDTTNLIWLQDWNVNGQADWATQTAWAGGLDYAGSSDWVLPTSDQYAALFAAYGDISAQQPPFTNVQGVDLRYWSSTEGGNPANRLIFDTFDGRATRNANVNDSFFAVALRPVPLPAAAWLFGSAILGLVGVARRKQA